MKNKGRSWHDKCFLFSWGKLAFIIVLWVVFVILHNLFYALSGYEEAVFFILAVIVLPVYTIIMVIYTLIKKLKIVAWVDRF